MTKCEPSAYFLRFAVSAKYLVDIQYGFFKIVTA